MRTSVASGTRKRANRITDQRRRADVSLERLIERLKLTGTKDEKLENLRKTVLACNNGKAVNVNDVASLVLHITHCGSCVGVHI
jgi:hypothetical protein